MRPARTPDEIRAASRVRFGSYAPLPGLHNFTSLDTSSALDVDVFDAYSMHLVLVASALELATAEQVVGTLRIASSGLSPQLHLVREAFADEPQLAQRLDRPRPAPLPMLSYLEQADALKCELDRDSAAGLMVAEPGRLAVSSRARRAIGRRHYSAGECMVEAALAFGFLVQRLDRVYLDCFPQLGGLYSRYGFTVVPGAEAVYQRSLRTEMLAMSATLDAVPTPVRLRINRLAEEYAYTDQMTVAGEATNTSRRNIGITESSDHSSYPALHNR